MVGLIPNHLGQPEHGVLALWSDKDRELGLESSSFSPALGKADHGEHVTQGARARRTSDTWNYLGNGLVPRQDAERY